MENIKTQILEVFGILRDYYRIRDESGHMAQMYLNALVEIEATYAEFWQFAEACLNNPAVHGLPSIRDVKTAIRAMRPAPAAPPEPERPTDPNELRQAKIAMLRGIYRHQGDTPFYRKLLGDRNDHRFAEFFRDMPAVTHEDVLASCRQSRPLARAKR